MVRARALVVFVLLLVLAPTAEAAVSVQMEGSLLVVGGTNDDRNSYLIEHFADASRNGIRVRQIGLGAPTISSDDPACVTNPVFNDVVCTPLADSILINSGFGDDTVVIGGSNV